MGRKLSHFEILEEVGAGAMGIVYKALDTNLKRTVAIKVLPAASVQDPDRKRRFIQEAQAASALNHPNIVTIHEIDSDGETDFIAMEYVEGQPLDKVIAAGRLGIERALKIAIQIADALSRAHERGIIHRDLKPANVI